MTILSFSEDWKAQKTSESLQSGQSATRVFNVYSNTHEELVSNVYAAIPVRLGDVFPGTFACLCTERNADRNTDDRTTWTVTCQYSSIISQNQAERITEQNPLNRKTQISWSSRTVMRAVTKCQASTFYQNFNTDVAIDASPVSVANSATDPFDPPLEVPITEWIMSCSKNIIGIPSWFAEYDNSVNDADMTILGGTYKKGTLKLEGITLGKEVQENGITYRPLTWNVVIAKPREKRARGTYTLQSGSEDPVPSTVPAETVVPEPWDVEVLDEGMRRYNSTTKKWENLTKDINKPAPLNGSGVMLNPTEDILPEAALYWRLFRPYPRKPFNILPWV